MKILAFILMFALMGCNQAGHTDVETPARKPPFLTQLKGQCGAVYESEGNRNGVRRLTGLHLFNASEPAFTTLTNAQGIEDLEFVATELRTPAFDMISNLPSLKSLKVVNCKFMPAQVSALQNLKELQELELTFTINDESAEAREKLLGKLSPGEKQTREALKRTGLSDNVVLDALLTDRAMPFLSKLTKLKTLILRNTGVSGEGLKHLQPLVEMESLDIGALGLTGKTAMPFQAMTNLHSLQYFNADDDIVEVLSKMTTLERLNIWSDDVTDVGASHLLNLRQLQRLEIRGNKMTDQGLAQLSQVPALKYLDLSYTEQITQDGIAQFRKLKPDVEIKYSPSRLP